MKELQKAHLQDPIKLKVNSVFKMVDSLQAYILPTPHNQKSVYLVQLIRTLEQKSVLIFCNQVRTVHKCTLILRKFGINAIPLYGSLSQEKRNSCLTAFAKKKKSILVATDVASR